MKNFIIYFKNKLYILTENSVSRLSRPTKAVKKIKKKTASDLLFDDMFGPSDSGFGTESSNSTAKDRLPPLPGIFQK